MQILSTPAAQFTLAGVAPRAERNGRRRGLAGRLAPGSVALVWLPAAMLVLAPAVPNALGRLRTRLSARDDGSVARAMSRMRALAMRDHSMAAVGRTCFAKSMPSGAPLASSSGRA